MITSPAFAGNSYAILGLARSGLATVQALAASGADIMAWDNSEEARGKVAGLFPGEGRGPGSLSLTGPLPSPGHKEGNTQHGSERRTFLARRS